ncbi:MAG: hypothetical protein CMJ64_29780, partial [Planctomycetaceae bacterium]|nr:hypothetical protein [Planctomycetaceae bacterium]
GRSCGSSGRYVFIPPAGFRRALRFLAAVYNWQTLFFENGTAAFERDDKRAHNAKGQRIKQLEEKLQKKNEVVAELIEEHVQLRKELGEL